MTRELNGAIYDTNHATVDKKFTFGTPGDPHGYEETLYVTHDGRYFVYTNGGSLSKYPTENMFVIQREDVKNWILSH